MKNFLCVENIKSVSNETLLEIIQSSSEMEGCPITNILESDEKTLWLSTEELPQEIIINLKRDLFKEMPKKISGIGIYCWHAYPTNPKLIEILISKNNGMNFISLGNFDLCLKPGKQLLQFDYELNPPLIKENKLDLIIKLIIKETFGDKRTYINNIYLYENINLTQNKLMTNMETIKEEDPNSIIYLRESREKVITKNIKEFNNANGNKDKIMNLSNQLMKNNLSEKIIFIKKDNKIIGKKIIRSNHLIPDYYKSDKDNWVPVWHGTRFESLESIMDIGLKLPGTKLKDGTVLKPLSYHIGRNITIDNIKDWANAIFVSQSIFYSADEAYANEIESNNKDWIVLVEGRAKIGSYYTRRHTFGNIENYKLLEGEPEGVEFRIEKESDIIVV